MSFHEAAWLWCGMLLRVVLGEDSLIVREGIRQLLDADPEMEVVAVAGDLASLREACDRERPDVVVTDIRMPPTQTDEGIRLAGELRERHPEIGVVVLSQYDDPSTRWRCSSAGPPAAPTCSRSECTTAPS